MAFRRVLLAGTRALSTIPQTGVSTTAAEAAMKPASVAPWIDGKPTRAIAEALMSKENYIAPHDALYEEVNQTGLFRSHRHFKHCLRMLKEQNRVKVICLGPEKVASNKRKFSVKLTARGWTTYKFFRTCHERIAKDNLDVEESQLGEGFKNPVP